MQVLKPIEDLVPLGDVLVVELAPLLDLLDVVLEVRKTLVGLGVANAALIENGPARLPGRKRKSECAIEGMPKNRDK